MAKNFAEFVNTRTRAKETQTRVSANIEAATAGRGTQEEADKKEKAKRASEMKTQGRKGCKLPRINLAFSAENHDFIQTVSRVRGQNLTQFVNFIIAKYAEEHSDLYEKAKKLLAEAEKYGEEEE